MDELPDITPKLNTVWRPIRQFLAGPGATLGAVIHLFWNIDSGKLDAATQMTAIAGDALVVVAGAIYTAFSAWQHVATSKQAHDAAVAVAVAAQAPAPAPTAAPVAP